MLEEEDLMEGWPQQGERRKLVNECNQREVTCLGLPVMTSTYQCMCYLFYQFVWVSVYMLCNVRHCSSLCCILILMGNVWHLFSLWYLRSIFLFCVNICTVRCFSNYCFPHPHLSDCWSFETAQYTTHRSWPHCWTQRWDPGAIAPPLQAVGERCITATEPVSVDGVCGDISNVFDVLWSYFLIRDISLMGMCFLCGGLNRFRLQLRWMLKFCFE